ncbi:MAG TPA: FxLYD domain-containing protein [Candidatus Binataceae bacterium]|nr:FxLYD domain-containing protein [Candidatus Binataceae bacterium]
MRKGTLFILLGAMAFAAIVFVLLAHVQPVKVIASRLEHDGDKVFVAGELRNTGARPASIDLEIHYYDRAGRPLGEDRLQVGPLGAGEREHFRGPAHAAGSVEDFSLYLNQGRNPYGN